MATVNITYNGDLRTECEHLSSGSKITTDAPTDNKGKGKKFSPTDLFATSLGTCVLTIMGIKARQRGLDITGTKVALTKVMANNPRRVAEVNMVITFPKKEYSKANKMLLERIVSYCPVKLSLHPDVKENVTFIWPT